VLRESGLFGANTALLFPYVTSPSTATVPCLSVKLTAVTVGPAIGLLNVAVTSVLADSFLAISTGDVRITVGGVCGTAESPSALAAASAPFASFPMTSAEASTPTFSLLSEQAAAEAMSGRIATQAMCRSTKDDRSIDWTS
jgi:hypothetical protein